MATPCRSPAERFDFLAAEQSQPGILRLRPISLDVDEPGAVRTATGTEPNSDAALAENVELFEDQVGIVAHESPPFPEWLLALCGLSAIAFPSRGIKRDWPETGQIE